MQRTLAVIFVLGFAIMAMAGPKSDVQLGILLNGKPTLLGRLMPVDGGAPSVSNSNTVDPFTLVAGSVIEVECEAASRVGLQATCTNSLTGNDGGTFGVGSNFCVPVAATPETRKFVVPDNVSVISMVPGTNAKGCVVWQLK